MSSIREPIRRWLTHRLPIPRDRQSWQETLGILLVLAVAGGLLWQRDHLSYVLQVCLWAALGVVTAFLARRGAVKLFGPVLFYDLLRVGRRSRYILFRTLYVGFLFALLSYVYSMTRWDWVVHNRSPVRQAAEFAESFFFTLMTVQLLVVLILTPAYLAGAIAEEKDRKTLEFLLATDLRGREIVLGKMLARLANMTLIVLAALPVLAAVQFFGGVDPDLLLASFAALGLTLLSLAAVSILMSVHSRKPRDAIVLTYLLVVMYPVLGFLALGLVKAVPWVGTLPLLPWPEGDSVWWLTGTDVVDLFNAGNLFWALGQLSMTLNRGGTLVGVLPDLLRDYALFHGGLALLCTVWAVVRLRPVALKEALGKPKRRSLGSRLFHRPPIGTQPMFWKEIYGESHLHFHWIGRVVVCVIVAITFLPVVFIFDKLFERNSLHYLTEAMNVWVRVAGTIVAVLLLLAVAVRASSSVSGERDRQTLDGLLTTPLDSNQILLAKWVGAILSVRQGWIWLGSIWALGVVTGGIHVFCLPSLLLAWLIYAGVFACVGLWFSVNSRTTLRSTMGTLLTVLFIGGAHWIVVGMCCMVPLSQAGASGHDFKYLGNFLLGQTPPFVLGILAFYEQDFRHSSEFFEFIGFSFLGLGCWAVGGMMLGHSLAERFRVATNRQPLLAPERPEMQPRDDKLANWNWPAETNGAENVTALVPDNQKGERGASAP